jgi:hypothetical protein
MARIIHLARHIAQSQLITPCKKPNGFFVRHPATTDGTDADIGSTA